MAAGIAAAAAVSSAMRSPPDHLAPEPQRPDRAGSHPADVAVLLRLRPALVTLGFVAGWAFVGGIPGVVVGCGVAAFGWRVLGRTEGPAARERRERMRAEQPVAVHLLAESLRSGAAVGPALGIVAEALPGPCGDAFAQIARQLRLGADPATIWADLADDAELAALGRSLGRAYETGAAVAEAIESLAVEQRARARSEVEQRAKSVDVRASAPLGVCFLPAFIVLGVVPLVAGIFMSMDLFG